MQKLYLRAGSPFTFLFLLIVIAPQASAQSPEDKKLILSQAFGTARYNPRNVSYMFKDSKSKFVKYNPVSLTLGGLMMFYQKVLSPQIISGCPYEISCSNFSKAVIRRYGLVKGVALTADRLTRCNSIAAKDFGVFDLNSNFKIVDPPEKYCR